MEHQALQHALQEADHELQLHQEIVGALAAHSTATATAAAAAAATVGGGYGAGGGGSSSTNSYVADHLAMHGMLMQRVQGAMAHQQRQRQVHADMVEEALAAAAAADGCHTDGGGGGGGSSGSGGSVG